MPAEKVASRNMSWVGSRTRVEKDPRKDTAKDTIILEPGLTLEHFLAFVFNIYGLSVAIPS